MPQLQFEIDFGQLSQSLTFASQHLLDQGLLTSIGLTLLRANEDRHERSVDPFGIAWKPISKEWEEDKKSRGLPEHILIEYGDLLRFYNHVDYHFGAGFVTIGTADWKGYLHQYGTKRMPARPIVGFPESDAELVDELISDHMDAILRMR